MQCPKCQAPMRSYERNGITIDQCTECRGIFLDRGELDHLITLEAAQAAQAAPAPAAAPSRQAPAAAYAPQQDYQQTYQQYGGKPPKRKKSFLEDLFD
jgi:Zn-finger nucleic acid-binding protein